MNEPVITINGKTLTTGQAMAVRVAVSSFLMELRTEGLGDDEHGRVMTAAYLARLGEIIVAMGQRPANGTDAPSDRS